MPSLADLVRDYRLNQDIGWRELSKRLNKSVGTLRKVAAGQPCRDRTEHNLRTRLAELTTPNAVATAGKETQGEVVRESCE